MDKKDYRVWEYERMVWKKAIKDTIDLYKTDWRAWFGSILSVIIALVVLRVMEGVPAVTNELTSILAGAIGALLSAFFILIIHRMSAPVILYREVEAKANKYTWDDVSINIVTLPAHNQPMAILDVRNNKPFDIQKAVVKLTNIQKDRFPFESKRLPLNLPWSIEKQHDEEEESLTWGGRKLHKNGEHPRALTVVVWSNESKGPALVTGSAEENHTGESDVIHIDPASTYKIDLEWFGDVDGHSMDAYETSYFLNYDGKRFILKEVK